MFSRLSMMSLAVAVGWLSATATSPANAEPFEWIMESASKAGSLSNNDGHQWKFRQGSGGRWEVEGARNEVATVTPSGENEIKLSGFPNNWGANGDYEFSRSDGECVLNSDHSQHKMKWSC